METQGLAQVTGVVHICNRSHRYVRYRFAAYLSSTPFQSPLALSSSVWQTSQVRQRRGAGVRASVHVDSKLDLSTNIWNDSWNERIGHFHLGFSFCLQRGLDRMSSRLTSMKKAWVPCTCTSFSWAIRPMAVRSRDM